MQVSSLPPPLLTGVQPQDVAAKAVPNLQATQPLVHNPVKAPPKGEKSNQSRSQKDPEGEKSKQSKNSQGDEGDADDRGQTINIRV